MTESGRPDVIRCRSQDAKIQLLTNQPGEKGVCSEVAGERWGSVGRGWRETGDGVPQNQPITCAGKSFSGSGKLNWLHRDTRRANGRWPGKQTDTDRISRSSSSSSRTTRMASTTTVVVAAAGGGWWW